MSLTPTQMHWAQIVVATTKAYRNSNGDPLPVRAAHIALATCLTESGLRMYANGNNSASLAIPHDAVGWDHGSVGLFQQQVGGAPHSTANWGTTAECMDPVHSTNKFLHVLNSFNWPSYSNWDAAQKVQGSYDPTGGNYKRNDAEAIALGNELWGSAAPAPVPAPKPPAHGIVGTYTVRSGDTLSAIAHRYPQTWVTWQSIAALNHLADPDKIYPGQVLRIG